MTSSITKVLPKFEALKASVLTDGKIDVSEVNELLEFIRPYCRTYNKKFHELQQILLISKDDNKITELESRAIVNALDNVTQFLKLERNIERFLTGIAIAVSAVGLAYLAVSLYMGS